MALGRRRIFAIAISVTIMVGVLVPTSAWVFYEDDRRPSHFVMVGRLEIKLPQGTASGTAALVDECGIPGYDAGPRGAIDEPRATAAIKRVQQDMAWPVSGEPTHSLWKILRLKALMS